MLTIGVPIHRAYFRKRDIYVLYYLRELTLYLRLQLITNMKLFVAPRQLIAIDDNKYVFFLSIRDRRGRGARFNVVYYCNDLERLCL